MITEIAVLQLHADADLADPSSPSSKILQGHLAQLLATPGARYAYYGQSIEQPKTALLFVGWDDIGIHKKSMSSPDYVDHVESLKSILNPGKDYIMFHVPFGLSDDVSPALGADSRVGVTEIVFFRFPSPLNTKDGIMHSIGHMRPVMESSEACAVFDGWAVEEIGNEKGEMNTLYVNAVGWVDIDAHMRTQASKDFKENIHYLMDIKEILHYEMHHTKLYKI